MMLVGGPGNIGVVSINPRGAQNCEITAVTDHYVTIITSKTSTTAECIEL